jgi:hypothetical protein
LASIQVAATRAGKKEVGERAVVNADVSIGRTKEVPGLGIQVVLRIEGVEDQAILDAAHEVGYTVVVTTTETDFVNRCVHTVALCARGLRLTLRRDRKMKTKKIDEDCIYMIFIDLFFVVVIFRLFFMMRQRVATSDLVQVLVMNVQYQYLQTKT